MKKTELQDIVNIVYASYNIDISIIERKSIYRAWWDILGDLDYSDVYNAHLKTAVYRQFMPRPGELRRIAIDMKTGFTQFEDPYSAWGTFVSIQKDANFGTQTKMPKSEALNKTLERLGSAVYEMHTNRDRDVFIAVYKEVVDELNMERYRVAEKPTGATIPKSGEISDAD